MLCTCAYFRAYGCEGVFVRASTSSSTSPPRGNQVDGLPRARSLGRDNALMTTRSQRLARDNSLMTTRS